MIRSAHMWLFGAAIWTGCAGASDVDLLMRDARIVYDVAGLRFDAGGPVAPWVLVKVTPSVGSGGATIPGAVIDGTTGRTSSRERISSGDIRIVEEGSWKLIAALDRYDGPRHGTYAWTKPSRTHERTAAPDDVYSPFTWGGIVACRLDASLGSEAAFQPSFLIPPGWEKQVRAAYRQFRKNPGLRTTAAASDPLAALVNPENKILAVISFRALAERGRMPVERVRRALSASRGYERSALIYALLTSRAGGMETALQDELEHLVRESSAGERHSMALGVFAARLFRPELYNDRLTQSLVASLLDASMHSPDSYLRRALQGSGTP